MEKKLYFTISGVPGAIPVTGTLEMVMNWIHEDAWSLNPENEPEYSYTLTPVWLTDEGFAAVSGAGIE